MLGRPEKWSWNLQLVVDERSLRQHRRKTDMRTLLRRRCVSSQCRQWRWATFGVGDPDGGSTARCSHPSAAVTDQHHKPPSRPTLDIDNEYRTTDLQHGYELDAFCWKTVGRRQCRQVAVHIHAESHRDSRWSNTYTCLGFRIIRLNPRCIKIVLCQSTSIV